MCQVNEVDQVISFGEKEDTFQTLEVLKQLLVVKQKLQQGM